MRFYGGMNNGRLAMSNFFHANPHIFSDIPRPMVILVFRVSHLKFGFLAKIPMLFPSLVFFKVYMYPIPYASMRLCHGCLAHGVKIANNASLFAKELNVNEEFTNK